jgi:hypothetical protein
MKVSVSYLVNGGTGRFLYQVVILKVGLFGRSSTESTLWAYRLPTKCTDVEINNEGALSGVSFSSS